MIERLSERLANDHHSGDLGLAIDGYAEVAKNLETTLYNYALAESAHLGLVGFEATKRASRIVNDICKPLNERQK